MFTFILSLVFMVEEPSMKAVLEAILPKILPEEMEKPLILPHRGKQDLAASIAKKLKSWPYHEDRFIIVHDQNSHEDCKQLKEELLALCRDSRNECLVRIVCRELKAW